MLKIGKLFRSRNFILILAIVLGLTLGQEVAVWTEPLTLPVLALIMTLSATNITSRDFVSLKAMPGQVLASLLLSYVIMGGITLLMAWWLIDDRELWAGFIVTATVPPGVAILPFSYMLGGNALFSLIGMTGAYLAALIIMPAAMVLFLGVSSFNTLDVLLILGELILIPVVISRILLFAGLVRRIKPWRGTMVNWGFFIVLFTIVGLNQQAFFTQPDVLLKIILIAIVISFALGHAIELVTRLLHISQETRISLILMGTFKNYGLASGILLALVGERAAIPASICVVFGILYLVWLGFRYRKPAC